MTDSPPIPSRPSDIAAEWLQRALSPSGLLGAARVSRCVAERIGEAFGFASQVARVHVTYDPPNSAAPTTLIAKLAAASDNSHPSEMLECKYAREAAFYREIGNRVGVPISACYFVGWQPEPPRFVLLLEDLGDVDFGDAEAGWSLAQGAAAIDTLAALHANWWRRPQLNELEWLPDFGEFSSQLAKLPARRPAFLSRFGELLPPELVTLTERLAPHSEAVLARLTADPSTLLHVDAHLDNFAFRSTEDGLTAILFDWQGTARGLGVVDLARFITGCAIEPRRANEAELVRRYHGALQARGIAGYSLEQLLADYRVALLRLWIGHVNGLGSPQAAAWTGRQAALVRQSVARMVAATMDHRVAELCVAG